MDELTSVYIQECREQLADMEAGLLRLEQAPEQGGFRVGHASVPRAGRTTKLKKETQTTVELKSRM